MKDNVFVYKLGENLYINLTNKCCNSCTFCLRNNGDGVAGQPLWLKREPNAAEVIEGIKNINFEYGEAVFCGYGESTYKMEVLAEVAEYLHAQGKKTRLNTNGLGDLINNRSIAAELKGKIDKVSVSLNEADAQSYADVCKPSFGLGAYEAILKFAVSCKNEGIDTVLTVVDVISKESIEKCRVICENLGVRFKVRKCIRDNISYT